MKKVVISGSAKLEHVILKWVEKLETLNLEVIDYPKPINKDSFKNLYPKRHKEFYNSIRNTDILFILNEDRNGEKGVIGTSTFAEISFGIMENLIYNKNIEIIILKMPENTSKCYDEIKLWLELGWLKIYQENEFM